jgi:transketolase
VKEVLVEGALRTGGAGGERATDVRGLELKAAEIRLELIRMFSHGKAHHFGGSLSCVDLLAGLYFHRMRYSAALRTDPQRDRCILSKGHSVPTQYVVLSMLGVLPRGELRTIKRLGTCFQGHPDMAKTPGIEAPTGSLGQGLSFANGVALAGRLDGLSFSVFVLLGDGELQEGQVWEAAMSTTHQRLNNVCVLVDYNKFQSQGSVEAIKSVEPLPEKWAAFGWDVVRLDGHDLASICSALDRVDGSNPKPLAIIADTVKGKGVSFMENTFKYHNAALTEDQYRQAEREILDRIDVLSARGA